MADLAITIDTSDIERATRSIQRFERHVKSLDPTFSRGRGVTSRYNRTLRAVRDSYNDVSVGARSAGASVTALNRQMNSQASAVRSSSTAYKGSTRSMNDLGVAMQQTGYQLGDFLVQVQSGTNAFVAFGQQATQAVGILPMFAQTLGVSQTALIAISASLGIAIPLITAFAGAITRTDDSGENLNRVLGELQSVLEPISPLLSQVSRAMAFMRDTMIDAANLVINNLDRILSYGITLAGFFTGKWVASFVAARVATLSLNGALVALRGTITSLLARTGLGALFVLMGEGVYQFVRLIKATGSFGEALNALGPLASSVWQGIIDSAKAIPPGLNAVWNKMKSDFLLRLSEMATSFFDFLWTISNSLQQTPGFEGVGDNLMKVTEAVDKASGFLSRKGHDAMFAAEDAFKNTSDVIKDAFEPATRAVEDLRKMLESGKDTIDIRDWFGLNGEQGEDENGAKSAADEVVSELTKIEQRAQSVADTMRDSMSEAFMGIVEGTKSASDAFMEMARKIVKELFDVLVVQRLVGSFNVSSGAGTGIVGSIMGAFFADGAAFQNGKVTPFADGGVVNQPTVFPMANGAGLMGEAGPEAVMPLKRGKDGKLGVQAQGNSQPVVINQTFQFSANGDDSVKRIITQEAPKIANLTKRQILDERSRGGAWKKTFG